MKTASAKLTTKLIRIQAKREYNKTKMAKKIGVTRQTYEKILFDPEYLKPPKFLAGIIKAFPQLKKDVMALLESPHNGQVH